MSLANRWQLYERMSGWGECNRRLDEALGIALKAMDDHIADGDTILQATLKSVAWMDKVMSNEDNLDFGAADSEPRNLMMDAIERHIKTRYGVNIDL